MTTFLTMVYILAVNPNIFDALGGEMSKANGAVFTATALAAILGTLAMAFIAKKPFALAPGMGVNTFFVYTVCIAMGHSWQFALTAVFWRASSLSSSRSPTCANGLSTHCHYR